jgi:sigma-E factor negative regulatory protein RseC
MERLWQPAIVLSSSRGRVRLRFDRLAECERCLRGEGCGAGVFTQLFSRRSTEVEVSTHQAWRAGQRVRIGLPASALLPGSVALYGWPLLGFLVGAATGQIVGPPGWHPDLTALAGGLLLGALTTWVSWRRGHHYGNPVIEALSCDPCQDRA